MNEPIIFVGVMSAEKIDFDLDGEFRLNGSKKRHNGFFSAKIVDNKICLSLDGESICKEDSLILEPTAFERDFFTLRDVVIGVQFHWEQKENQKFQGSLKLIIEDGKITAINIIPIENYLLSVISSEMSAKCNEELLKAHSIISRSWLLAQIEKSKSLLKEKKEYKSAVVLEGEYIKWYDREDHKNFDVCADDHCQRYQGVTKAYTDAVKKAVDFTRGTVITYNGKVCDARFSKSCGGISENFENVWEPTFHPYLTHVVDYKYNIENYKIDFSNEENAEKWIRTSPPAFCNTNDKKILSQVLLDYDQKTTDFYRWTLEYSQEEISKIIKDRSGIDFGDIIDLIPAERGYSARLIKLKIVGSKKTLIIGKELEIRRTLSPKHLYSSAFVVEKSEMNNGIPGKFKLIGAGWGHGVGLCQIGAAVMSEKGYKFDEILLHYFKDSKLSKIYK